MIKNKIEQMFQSSTSQAPRSLLTKMCIMPLNQHNLFSYLLGRTKTKIILNSSEYSLWHGDKISSKVRYHFLAVRTSYSALRNERFPEKNYSIY